MQNFNIPAGKLIAFATGEYSDYSLQGHFVTLQDITNEIAIEAKEKAEKKEKDNDAAMDKWRKDGGDYPGYVCNHEAFIAELIRQGFLMSIDVHELHIGSYGRIEL